MFCIICFFISLGSLYLNIHIPIVCFFSSISNFSSIFILSSSSFFSLSCFIFFLFFSDLAVSNCMNNCAPLLPVSSICQILYQNEEKVYICLCVCYCVHCDILFFIFLRMTHCDKFIAIYKTELI